MLDVHVGSDFCWALAYFEENHRKNFPDHLPAVGHDNSWFNSKDICQQKLMRSSKIQK